MNRTYLVVHPGSELFGSDRMVLETVAGLTGDATRVVAAIPENGPLVTELRKSGAEVVIVRMLVLRKALMSPTGWPRLIVETLRGFRTAWRLVTRVRPDALLVNTITIPLWPVVARLRGIPALSHVHEAEASGSRFVNRLLYAPHTTAQAVVTNSEFSRETIRSALPALARRSVVVYNGVGGPEETVPPRAELGDRVRLLYVGRLSPRKGVDLIVRAAALLEHAGEGVTLDILGSTFPGYEWFEDELRQLVTTSGLEPHVTFHGFVSDVWPALAACDALVVPSRVDEPFGNTAVEGLLALRPVVVSDTSGLREAAGGYPSALFFAPGDERSLADALRRLRSRWPALTSATKTSAATAAERHGPAVYRSRMAEAMHAISD